MPKRIDPPSRSVDGAITDVAHIANKDPNRVYCLANPNDAYCGADEMVRQGWEVETVRKDGPRVTGGAAASDGSAVTMFGQVLMSRSREAHEAYEARKADVANMRSRAIGQRGGIDPFVGPAGKVAEHTVDPGEYVERFRS